MSKRHSLSDADSERQPSPAVRVLIVDDHEPWRRWVYSELGSQPQLQVVGETSDGLDAVRKAQELQPDLILLDIGLPGLNGIEAAREIRRLSPESKIVFMSQESSTDVVQQALSLGACGYVVKMDAGRELLAAVDAVLRDEHFVGSRFAGHDFTGASNIPASDEAAPESFRRESFRRETFFAPHLQNKGIARRHEVEFYSDDGSLLDGFARFIGAALTAGKAVIVVATETHRDSLLLRLQAQGLDIGAAIEGGRYLPLDAADTLSTFMVNGSVDPVRFLKVAGDLIVASAKAVNGEPARVATCGECAPLLWEQGNTEAAIRVEHLWDEIAITYQVDILCVYSLNNFQGGVGSHVFEEICAAHSAFHSQ